MEDILVHELEALSVSRQESVVAPSVTPYYVYDEAMREHSAGSSQHMHPEQPDRISTIHEYLTKQGLVDRMTRIHSREAAVEELCLAHTAEMVDAVLGCVEKFEKNDDSAETNSVDQEKEHIAKKKKLLFPFDNDTYVCERSVAAAKLACGSVLAVVDAVLGGASTGRGFCAVRPPGHHATHTSPMGFCLFNNVAVAARYAQQRHGLGKIGIIDWDVHHGNGTQNIFESDKTVLFISIHRFDGGRFYPGSGDCTEIGLDEGKGFTINCPIDGSYGDDELLYLFDSVVLPALTEFCPELILVSAGFDAAEHDPLGLCHVRPSTYGQLTKSLLQSFPATPTVLVLEGGYNLKSIGQASVACVQALLGRSYSHTSPALSALGSPRDVSSPFLGSSISSSPSSIRSVPIGWPKTCVVRMAHRLTQLLNDCGVWKRLPVAPSEVESIERHKELIELLQAEEKTERLLLSGGGHPGAVTQYGPDKVIKETSVKEAIAYWLLGQARVDGTESSLPSHRLTLADVIVESDLVDFPRLVAEERDRLGWRASSCSAISQFVPVCYKIFIHSQDTASIVLSDATSEFAKDDSLGVLDVKLGQVYHTPDDHPDKVITRRQKANRTSAGTLGMRIVACACSDGFQVSKVKGQKLKTINQMVPLFRRFLFSPVEDFDMLVAEAVSFVQTLKDAFSDKLANFSLVAASLLFVVGRDKSTNKPKLHCNLIDLAHLVTLSPVYADGLQLGCASLLQLLEKAHTGADLD